LRISAWEELGTQRVQMPKGALAAQGTNIARRLAKGEQRLALQGTFVTALIM
jgi:hypothetical protein